MSAAADRKYKTRFRTTSEYGGDGSISGGQVNSGPFIYFQF